MLSVIRMNDPSGVSRARLYKSFNPDTNGLPVEKLVDVALEWLVLRNSVNMQWMKLRGPAFEWFTLVHKP